MGKRAKLGAVVDSHKGYNIRQMLRSMTHPKTKANVSVHTGTYGIYTRKKLVTDTVSLESARSFIDGMVATSIKNRKMAEEAQAKRIEEIRKANRMTW